MSELPHNDMERDGKLTALYRAAGEDVPPAALDDAILAAARRAAGARPRTAGYAFGHAWRVPLSIAAVVVLSVSLVTVMREEAPELTEPPGAVPAPATLENKSATVADAGSVAGTPGFVPDELRSKSIGLKPPPAGSPGVDLRQAESGERAVLSRKEKTADTLAADATAPPELAKRRDAPALVVEPSASGPAPAAPPASAVARGNALKDNSLQPSAAAAPAANVAELKPQVAAETAAPPRTERESQNREAPAPARASALDKATVAGQSAPAADLRQAAPAKTVPQASSVMGKLANDAGLPPEKWLERIEELRKQGKFDEAKASLAEFKKRFPNYPLPDALRAWSIP
jgi:hypothetical protein